MPIECERSDSSPDDMQQPQSQSQTQSQLQPQTQEQELEQKMEGSDTSKDPELTREEKINALEKMDFGKDVQNLNGEMSTSQTSTTSSNNSLNGSVISNGSGKKTSLISPDPTAYVTKARVTRPTPPPPPYNPMQYVQTKPCNLYQKAQQQLKKAEEVKKIKEIKKEEPEDWQNNLDNWKSSRRKRVEHIIDRVVEVKKLELEEHDRTRKKSKTFSEMMEKRGERNGGRGLTKLASLAVYNEDESNDFSDLGIGTSSASGKSSLSEDYDNNSVLSDNNEAEKAIYENKEKQTNSTTREYTSSPGYETSSSTAAASSPDPCEYTYEGAIQDYKQRVSRATAKSVNNFNKLYSNTNGNNNPGAVSSETTTSTIGAKELPSQDAERFKNSSSEYYPIRRGSKIEDRLSSFEVSSPSDTQENAETKKVDVPKIDISKRKEIFEQQQQENNMKPLTNGGSQVPKVALRDRFKFEATNGSSPTEAKPTSPKKDVKRLSGDITSIKERLQSLEQQKNATSNGTNDSGKNGSTSSKIVDIPVPPLKDRLSSLQNAVTKEEIKKPPVALVDARQLEIMKNEEEQRMKLFERQESQGLGLLPKETIMTFIEEEKKASNANQIAKDIPKIEDINHDDSGIHTADDIENENRSPEPIKNNQEDQLNAAIAALALEEKQLEQAANAVNQIEAEFAGLSSAGIPTTHVAANQQQPIQQSQTQPQSQQSQQSQPPIIEMEFSQINEALELALEEIDKEVGNISINQNKEENQKNIQENLKQKQSIETKTETIITNTININKDDNNCLNNDDLEKRIAREPIYENIQTTQLQTTKSTNTNNNSSSKTNTVEITSNTSSIGTTNSVNTSTISTTTVMTTQLQSQPQPPPPPLPLQEPPTLSAPTKTIISTTNISMHNLDMETNDIPNNNLNLNQNNNNQNINNNDYNNININFKNLNRQTVISEEKQKKNILNITDYIEGLRESDSGQDQQQHLTKIQENFSNNKNIITNSSILTNNLTSTSYLSRQNLEPLSQIQEDDLSAKKSHPSQHLQHSTESLHSTPNTEELSIQSSENEPYYQVPKSSEPYYDAPKHLKPVPVYENIEIFYNGLDNSSIITNSKDMIKLEPPKEKPPPPPCDSPPLLDDVDGANNTDTWSSADNTYETIPTAHRRQQNGHLNSDHPSPPIKRMNSTKRIKKELRNKRSSFLGIEDSLDQDDAYLELTVAPPPDMDQILQEERRLEKQLYLKAGLCDSSDTGESRDSGVSENHSRQSSEHYTNSSEENESHHGSDGMPSLKQSEIIYQNESPTLLTAAQTPLLQTVKGNSAESWTESATVAAAATKSLTEAQATANAKMLSIEEKIREQEEVLRVERELLHFSQEELKRQRENLMIRENMARMELQHGAKMLMSANRHSLQDLNGLNINGGIMQVNNGFQPTLVPQAAQVLRAQHIYANVPNLQQQYYRQADMDYRKSMSDLNEFSKRLSLPPVPPTKPMRAMHISTNGHIDDFTGRQRHSLNAVNAANYGGSLVKIATPLPTAAPRNAGFSNFHHQSAQNLNQITSHQNPNVNVNSTNTNAGHVIHHGNMTRNTLHALSATPKPKYTDDWVQVQTRKNFESSANLANDPAWLSAYQQKRKSMPDSYHNYNNNAHWMVQEAEQRRIVEQQSRRCTQNTKVTLSSTNSTNSNGKPLPDSIIQTLTERVQSKGIGERKRFENYSISANNSPSHFATNYQPREQTIHQNYSNLMSPVKHQGMHPQPQQAIQQQQQSHMNSSKATNITNGNNAVASQEKVLSVSGKKKCSHCGEELGRGAAMIIESLLLFYHINCFKCCVCHVQLGDGLNGTDVRVRNHKLHCQNCYSSDDGIKFSCV